MKKFWQTEWQGILFSTFAKLSSTELAGEEFYNAFTERFSNDTEVIKTWTRNGEVTRMLLLTGLLGNCQATLVYYQWGVG